jgi:hypothetical protein
MQKLAILEGLSDTLIEWKSPIDRGRPKPPAKGGISAISKYARPLAPSPTSTATGMDASKVLVSRTTTKLFTAYSPAFSGNWVRLFCPRVYLKGVASRSALVRTPRLCVGVPVRER